MSDKPPFNTFQYELTSFGVASVLAHRLIDGAKMIQASNGFIYDQAKHRGQLHIILSQLETYLEDARASLAEIAARDGAESLSQGGDQ